MATSDENIKIVRTVSSVFMADNSGDSSRAYDISAEINVSDGELCNISNGHIYVTAGEVPRGVLLATFGTNVNGGLWLNTVGTAEQNISIMQAVNGFIQDISTIDLTEL